MTGRRHRNGGTRVSYGTSCPWVQASGSEPGELQKSTGKPIGLSVHAYSHGGMYILEPLLFTERL